MSAKARLVSALIAALSFATSAFALEQCPVSDADTDKAGSYFEAVKAAVREAPSCDRAFKIAEACPSNTVLLLEIVQSKCEPLFMTRADAATKKAYERAKERCNKIIQRNEGTMYYGLAAICQAEKARDFARQYGGGKK